MKISDAAQASGLPVKTVRYYADIGLVVPAGRTESGYRDYDDVSLRKLVFARRAREFGFSVNQCRDLLELWEDKERSNKDVREMAQKRLSEIARKQEELQKLHDALAHLVNECKGDGRSDCPIIDYLG